MNSKKEKYYICIYSSDDIEKLILSHNPKLTLFYLNILKGVKEINFLQPELKISETDFILRNIEEIYKANNYTNSKQIIKFFQSKFNPLAKKHRVLEIEKYAAKEYQKIYKHSGIEKNQPYTTTLTIPSSFNESDFEKPNEQEINDIMSLLDGRKIFEEEIHQGIKEIGLNINGNITELLHWLQLENIIEIKPSIIFDEKYNMQCQRCGQSDKIYSMECQDCGTQCNYCENCVSMGEARSCRPLYCWTGSRVNINQTEVNKIKLKENKNVLHTSVLDLFGQTPEITLTKAQQDAYDNLCTFVDSKLERALVWAVCGAGKTEIVFGAIQKVLTKGEKVLFAIPRKDVVLELYPRLNKYFNQYNILPLYGGCPKKYPPSNLVVATTHQTIRYQEAFDLVILDEVDAFPYKDSKMLYYAVEKAKKKDGKIIYMTATPEKKLVSQSKKQGWQQIVISARYHGHPLPVPEVIIEKNKDHLSDEVWEMIKRSVLKEMVQLFIFVPSIEMAEKMGKLISEEIESRGIGPREWVKLSHSKDSKREEKRQGFSNGDFPILVSTTIMERGITVPKANVLVLYAHWEKIFDEGTLIQMAGRAGRSKEYPEGKVVFYGEKITESMKEARNTLIRLNKQSEEKGYINRAT